MPQRNGRRGPDRLTKRERDVVKLVAQGLTTTAIARRLNLSRFTVEGYRQSILHKLDLTRSTALVAWAVREGLA